MDRAVDPGGRRRVRYQLSGHGRRLLPIPLDIIAWSHRHTPDVDVAHEMVAQIEAHRDVVVDHVLRGLPADGRERT